jgi:hypothetical protein
MTKTDLIVRTWNRFKRWLLLPEIEDLEDHFRWKRDSMEREFAQRRQYLEDSHQQIRYMNDHLMNLITEKASLDPVPPMIIAKDKLQ